MTDSNLNVSSRTVAVVSSKIFLGLAMLVLGTAGAIALLDGVLEKGDLSLHDPAVTRAVIADRSAILTVLAQALTFMGSATMLVPLTLIVLVALAVQRRWRPAMALAAGMTMSLALTLVLKNVVARTRPPAADLLGAVNTGFAFPSGHTLNATVFYGLIAGLLLVGSRTIGVRVCAVVVWLTLAMGVGVSRVYLGYHWFTDVLAGWSLGIAILGAVLLVNFVLWRRRTLQNA